MAYCCESIARVNKANIFGGAIIKNHTSATFSRLELQPQDQNRLP